MMELGRSKYPFVGFSFFPDPVFAFRNFATRSQQCKNPFNIVQSTLCIQRDCPIFGFMTKTVARSSFGLWVFMVLLLGFFSSCATSFKSKEEILQSARAVELKKVGGLAEPGIRVISVDDKGFINVEDRFPGRTMEEMQRRLDKPDRQHLFALIDTLETFSLKEEYQIGEDATTYTFDIYQDGNKIRTVRYSSGAPRILLQIVSELEKIAQDE